MNHLKDNMELVEAIAEYLALSKPDYPGDAASKAVRQAIDILDVIEDNLIFPDDS